MIRNVILLGDAECSGTSLVKSTLNDILFNSKAVSNNPKSTYLVVRSLLNGGFSECVDKFVNGDTKYALGNIVHRKYSVDLTLRDNHEEMINQLITRLVCEPLRWDPDTTFVVFTKGDNVLMNSIVDVIKKSISGHLYVADYTWCRPGPYNITVCNTEYFNLSKGK